MSEITPKDLIDAYEQGRALGVPGQFPRTRTVVAGLFTPLSCEGCRGGLSYGETYWTVPPSKVMCRLCYETHSANAPGPCSSHFPAN